MSNLKDGRGGQEPRVRLIAFNDIKLGKQRRYVVKGLIPRVGLTVVWGPPKSGKSFWTFDLVMHVALDWEYRGRRVSHGPVVYCAFEGQTGLEARIEAFRQRHLPEVDVDVPFFLSQQRWTSLPSSTRSLQSSESELETHRRQ